MKCAMGLSCLGQRRAARARKVLAVRVGLATLLLVHASLLAWSAARHSPVRGEESFLPAGLSHVCLGRFDLYRVNPPLVRMVAALPVALSSPITDWSRYSAEPLRRSELVVAMDFLDANGSRSFWFFRLGRWACIPLSLLGGLVCFRWAADLYGTASGMFALALWCFSPYVLGHASLMTADAHATAIGLAACYLFWRWLKDPCWYRATIAGIVLGLAELAKFTFLLFYLLWPVLWVARRRPENPLGRGGRGWLREFGMLTGTLTLGVFVINTGYGFEGSLQALGSYQFKSSALNGRGPAAPSSRAPGNRFSGTWLASMPVAVPRNFLQGIDEQRWDFERKQRSYLRGSWQMGGWWYYYLYALAIKVPLGTWLLLLLAMVVSAGGAGYSGCWRDETALLLPLTAILVFVSSQTGFSHHSRYVLPTLPFAFIWTSKVARALELHHRTVACMAATALCWSVVSSLWVYPHSLSYFNELVGGPRRGHAHLLNSNIGWGQDLFYLRDWLRDHPEARPLHLASFGWVDPRLAGIEFTIPPVGPAFRECSPRLPHELLGPLPGWYAIEVNHLHGTDRQTADGRGGWCVLESGDYDYSYFRCFRPVAMAGYSIYIYHITLDGANRVRRELGLPELACAASGTDRGRNDEQGGER